MAKQIIDDALWKDDINAACRYYDEWASLFKCDLLEKYYEGFQWENNTAGYTPYVVNLIYETIQIKLGQFVPRQLEFEVSPRMGNSDFNQADAIASANIKGDALNTICQDNKQHFFDELELAFKDSYFRFGVIEVGHAADWIVNPKAPKPGLDIDKTKQADRNNPKIKFEPPELPVNERVYIKSIPAKRFRVGGFDGRYLERCDWCGYYEWVDKNDLLAIKGLMNRDKIDASVVSIPDSYLANKKDRPQEGNLIKIWHIYHNKFRIRLIILDSPCVTIYQKSEKRNPFIDFCWDKRVSADSFYPIPPVFHWLSPQNEANETREQLRKHRRRFNRKFQVLESLVDDEEIEKFESGEDGTLIKVKQPQAISAIDNPDLGPALDKAIVTSADDINKLSKTSAEVRGVADRTTATQANIISQQSQVGEDSDRDRVSGWYKRIGREILLTARDKFTIGLWALTKQNPNENIFQTIQNQPQAYKFVSTEDLNDGYDFKITIDVTTLTPASMQQEQQKFLLFLSIVNQFPQIAMSPTLIREAAYRCDYRNEKAIAELQKMALLHQFAIQQQMQQPGQSQMGQQQLAKRTPNTMEKVRNQLSAQVPGMGG